MDASIHGARLGRDEAGVFARKDGQVQVRKEQVRVGDSVDPAMKGDFDATLAPDRGKVPKDVARRLKPGVPFVKQNDDAALADNFPFMLAEIYGSGLIYNPVTSYRAPGYLQGDRAVRDFRTGDPLSIAGAMRCICHATVATAEGLDLLREAGHRLPPLLVFDNETKYHNLLRSLAGETIVFQHVHAPGEFDDYWIPRRLLQTLNNKAHLPELVPQHQHPRRLQRPELPCVIKRATDWTTGGGRSVRICQEDPGDTDGYIIEELVEFEETWCIQFATSGERIVELGFAPQVSAPSGRFLGSRFDREKRIPAAIQDAARAIMERAVARGYRGVAGFDVGSNGLFFDLNFRLNGSTAPLLNLRAASEWMDARYLRSGTWRVDCLRVAREAYRAHRFWPLSTYVSGDDCRVSGLIRLPSRSRPGDPPASFPLH